MRWFTLMFGGYALGAGLVTLLGWAGNIPRLTAWDANGISMFVNTALAATVLGVALVLLMYNRRVAAAVFAAAAGLLGLATLAEHLTGLNLGIDTLLFSNPWG